MPDMVLAAFWFSIMALLVKVCGSTIPALQIVFVRALVTLVLSGIGLWKRRLSPWGQRRGLLLLRGLFGSGGLICFYTAIVHMPLGDVNAIQQTSPLWTALLAAWILGERLDPRVLWAIALSLAGVLCIAPPGFATGLLGGEATAQPYAWLALAGALCAAAAYVTVRVLGRSEHRLVVIFYFPLVTLPLISGWVFAGWVDPTAGEWVALIGVGVATQLAQLALTRGLQRERAGRATAVTYLQVALAVFWGWLFFGELPTLWAAVGMGLVVAGVLVASTRRRAG